MADVGKMDRNLALEAVRRIDAIFDLERPLIGVPEDQRLSLRRQYVAPQVEARFQWVQRRLFDLAAVDVPDLTPSLGIVCSSRE